MVADIYGARESAEIRASVCAEDLVQAVCANGGRCEAGGPIAGLPARVAASHKAGEIVLVLGAGDIDGAVEGILRDL